MVMSWPTFQGYLNGQAEPGTLDTFIAISDELIRQGYDVPDGGEWKGSSHQGLGVVKKADGSRWAYRNYAEIEEITLPGGQRGCYVHAHAPSAARFR